MGSLKQKLLNLDKIFIDNEYLDSYCELISSNQQTKQEKYKTQKHHILPRSFEQKDNELWNITVNLLYKDHILAHYYLCLCTTQAYHIYMYNAISYLLGKSKQNTLDTYNDLKQYLTSLDKYQELYEEHRLTAAKKQLGSKHPTSGKKISEANKGKVKSEEWRKHLSESHKGHHPSLETRKRQSEAAKKRVRKPLSDDTRKKISEALTGRNLSEDHRKRLSEIHKGKPAWNKGLTGVIHRSDETRERQRLSALGKNANRIYIYKIEKDNTLHIKHIKPEELESYLSAGWYVGKPNKQKFLGKRSYWYNDGIRDYLISEDDLEYYINLGYKKGRINYKRKENSK